MTSSEDIAIKGHNETAKIKYGLKRALSILRIIGERARGPFHSFKSIYGRYFYDISCCNN